MNGEDHAPGDCNNGEKKTGKNKAKTCLRLKLVRAFSSGSLRNQKSPEPTSSGQNSPMSFPGSPRGSPSQGSPVFQKTKSRSSWYTFTHHHHRNRSSSSSLSNSSMSSAAKWFGDDSLPQSPYSPVEFEGARDVKRSFIYEKTKSGRSWKNVGHVDRHRSFSSLSNSPVLKSPPGLDHRGSVDSSSPSPITSKELEELRKDFADHKTKSRHSWYTINNPHRHRSYSSLSNSATPSFRTYTHHSSVPPSPCSPMTPKSATYAKSVTDQWRKRTSKKQESNV